MHHAWHTQKFMVQTTALADNEQVDKDTFVKEARKDLKEVGAPIRAGN